MKKVSEPKFKRYWDSIINYGELQTTMSFYPKNCGQDLPKVVFLVGATPITVSDYFQHGLIDTIYFNLNMIREFLLRLQQALKAYDKNFGKGRELFLRTCSSYLVFKDVSVLVSSLCIGFLGVNGAINYPCRDEFPKIVPTPKLFTKTLSGTHNASRQVGVPGKKMDVKVAYYSPTIIIYRHINRQITKEESNLFAKFEEPFETMKGILAPLLLEINQELCSLL